MGDAMTKLDHAKTARFPVARRVLAQGQDRIEPQRAPFARAFSRPAVGERWEAKCRANRDHWYIAREAKSPSDIWRRSGGEGASASNTPATNPAQAPAAAPALLSITPGGAGAPPASPVTVAPA